MGSVTIEIRLQKHGFCDDRDPLTEAWVGSEGKSSGTAVLAKDITEA